MKSILICGTFDQPLKKLLEENLRQSEFDVKDLSNVGSLQNQLPPINKTPAVNTNQASFEDEELRATLESADVILYSLGHSDHGDLATTLRVLNRRQEGKETAFIAVSNLLSWGRLMVDSDEPCSISDETRRRPHPQYGDLLEAERKVMRAQKQGLLKTYVVWPGIQYGEGEGTFEEIFQDSWSGVGPTIQGFGDNVLPTVHVRDLASFIKHVALTLPPEQLLMAVDEAGCTQQALIEKSASHFGADVRRTPAEDRWRVGKRVDPRLLLNLPLRATPLEGMTWNFKEGPIYHVSRLADDFLARRGLSPLRVAIHGPPAAGKSALARALSEVYHVDVLSVAAIIKWALEECEDASLKQSVAVVLAPPVQPPELKKKGQPAAPSPEPLKRPRLPDALLVKAVRSYLTAGKQGPELRRNGFILDGFPKTLAQTQLLFADENIVAEAGRTPEPAPAEPEPLAKLPKGNGKPEEKLEAANKFSRQKSVTRSSGLSASSSTLTPANFPESRLSSAPEESVETSQKQAQRKAGQCKLALDWAVFLKAPDEILAARVAAIPEAERAGTHNVGTEFARRISLYQESSLTDFDEIVGSVRSAGASVIEVDQAEVPPASGAETDRSDRSEESKRSADVDGRLPSDEEQAEDDEPPDTDQQDLTEDELVTSADAPAVPLPTTGTESEARSRRESPKEPASQPQVLELAPDSAPAKAEPTGMSLAVVIARVRGAIGPPEKYAGAKRKQGSRNRESEAEQGPEQQLQGEDAGNEASEEVAALREEATPQSPDAATGLEEPARALPDKLRATLEARSAGVQAWLASAVMPTVLQAMLHAARSRAEDPAEAMARHLLHLVGLQQAQERAQAS